MGSSAVRLAVSVKPEAPIPPLLGLGRWLFAFSSRHSRTRAAMDIFRSAAMMRSRSIKSSEMEIVVRCIAS